MQLVFFTEARFIKNAKGDIFNAEGSLNYLLWTRYLEYFDSVVVVARVKLDTDYMGNEHNISSGESVIYVELPYYIGPKDFLIQRRRIRNIISKICIKGRAYLMRVPGSIGNLASSELKKKGIPYGVEVVGDPIDVFSKGSVNHPLRRYFQYVGFKQLKFIVCNSAAALYVTEGKLQKRYPAADGAFRTSASNVILKEEFIASSAKVLTDKPHYKVLCIGSLAQMYKAPDIVLKSISQLKSSGFSFELTWLGAGKFLPELQKYATELGVDQQVNFGGYVADRDTLIKHLDTADIFVLVSRTEGLPRVIIEAMARGLPVIGSNVGGIPELIQPELLVEKDNANHLTEKLVQLVSNLEFTNSIAKQNLEKSRRYSEAVLNERRSVFYDKIIDITENAQ